MSNGLQITGAAPPEETPAATAAAAEGTEGPEGETQHQSEGTGDGDGAQIAPETATETAAPGGEFRLAVTTQGVRRANAAFFFFSEFVCRGLFGADLGLALPRTVVSMGRGDKLRRKYCVR